MFSKKHLSTPVILKLDFERCGIKTEPKYPSEPKTRTFFIEI